MRLPLGFQKDLKFVANLSNCSINQKVSFGVLPEPQPQPLLLQQLGFDWNLNFQRDLVSDCLS